MRKKKNVINKIKTIDKVKYFCVFMYTYQLDYLIDKIKYKICMYVCTTGQSIYFHITSIQPQTLQNNC